MRLLWVTTKPPWPPVDGGRLAAALTIEALVRAGRRVDVLSPRTSPAATGACDAPALAGLTVRHVVASPAPTWRAAAKAWLTARPVSIVRHTLAPVRLACERLLEEEAPRFDAVVAEQLQALPQCEPAFARGLTVLLRAQNVESGLWAAGADTARWLRAPLRREAARLSAYEAAAVRRVAATLALSAADAAWLRRLADAAGGSAPGGEPPAVLHVPVAFPPELPAADVALPGAPAVVLFGSAGWRPNAAGAAWFVERVWPAVRRALPGARLHVFGPQPGRVARRGRDGLSLHPAPDDSRTAFAPGSVLAVPLHVASGVRMRILEAWARGVPVVATSTAAAGLDAQDRRELLLAEDAEGFARALRRLSESRDLAAALAAAGRKRLRDGHDPRMVALRWAAVVEQRRRASRGAP